MSLERTAGPSEPGRSCPNCGASAPLRYCPSCGQDQRDPRQSLIRWLGSFIEEELLLGARVPRTVLALFRGPGLLTEDWIAGRRARWVHPVRLYLAASVVFFGVSFFMGIPFLPGARPDQATPLGRTVEEIAMGAIGARLQSLLTLAVLLLVPVYALVLRVVHRKRPFVVVDHLVFSLHQHAALLLLLTVVWMLLHLEWAWLAWALGIGVPLAAAVHVWRAHRRVYGSERSLRRFAVGGTAWSVAVLAVLVGAMAEAGRLLDTEYDPAWRYHAFRTYLASERADSAIEPAGRRALKEEALAAYDRVRRRFRLAHDEYHIAELRFDLGQSDAVGALIRARLDSLPRDPWFLGLAMTRAVAAADDDEAHEMARRFLAARSGAPPDTSTLHGRRFQGYVERAESIVELMDPPRTPPSGGR